MWACSRFRKTASQCPRNSSHKRLFLVARGGARLLPLRLQALDRLDGLAAVFQREELRGAPDERLLFGRIAVRATRRADSAAGRSRRRIPSVSSRPGARSTGKCRRHSCGASRSTAATARQSGPRRFARSRRRAAARGWPCALRHSSAAASPAPRNNHGRAGRRSARPR